MMTTVAPGLILGVAPRVNLMPRAETERRARSKLLRRWVLALVVALSVVIAVIAGGMWLNVTAAARLLGENARTQSLLSQLDGLSDVRAKVELQSELTEFRQNAMATDLAWSGLLTSVAGVLPEGVVVSGFSLAPAGIPQGDVPEEEIGAAGIVEITSQSPQDIVALSRAVRPLAGVIDADPLSVTLEEAAYVYELRIAFDQTVYTGDFAQEEDE